LILAAIVAILGGLYLWLREAPKPVPVGAPPASSRSTTAVSVWPM